MYVHSLGFKFDISQDLISCEDHKIESLFFRCIRLSGYIVQYLGFKKFSVNKFWDLKLSNRNQHFFWLQIFLTYLQQFGHETHELKLQMS